MKEVLWWKGLTIWRRKKRARKGEKGWEKRRCILLAGLAMKEGRKARKARKERKERKEGRKGREGKGGKEGRKGKEGRTGSERKEKKGRKKGRNKRNGKARWKGRTGKERKNTLLKGIIVSPVREGDKGLCFLALRAGGDYTWGETG